MIVVILSGDEHTRLNNILDETISILVPQVINESYSKYYNLRTRSRNSQRIKCVVRIRAGSNIFYNLRPCLQNKMFVSLSLPFYEQRKEMETELKNLN